MGVTSPGIRGERCWRQMDSGLVVVAGGAGFIGSHLCEQLLVRDHRVVCIDNFSTGDHSNVEHLLEDPRFLLIEHDITVPLPRFDVVDAVLNLASPASLLHIARLPLETLWAGALGTQNCLDLAREHRARFVLASTSEVYGDATRQPQDESYWGNVNPVGPRSVYDEGKRFAETLTAAYRRVYEVDTAIARIFNCYGPRLRIDDGRAVPTFILQALRNEPITVSGDGSQTRSFCFVADLVIGLLALLDSDVAGPVNLGTAEELTILELAETVKALVRSESQIVFAARPVDDPSARCPDLSLARSQLGWAPRVRLEEGLRQTVAWFRDGEARTWQMADEGTTVGSA